MRAASRAHPAAGGAGPQAYCEASRAATPIPGLAPGCGLLWRQAPMSGTTESDPLRRRIAALRWDELLARLDHQGFAQTPVLLSARECSALAALYESGSFRSTVVMGRHRFGEGEYKYFADPLPATVAELRAGLYPPLAVLANSWAERLREDVRYPATLRAFLERCHRAGQTRPRR